MLSRTAPYNIVLKNHLLALGSTEAEIAQTLTELGIKGNRTVQHHPLVEYVISKEPVWTGASGGGYIGFQIKDGPILAEFFMDKEPGLEAIHQFSEAFHKHIYPQLEL